MQKNNPTKEIEQLYLLVKKLIDEKYANEEIIKQLQKQGLEPYYIKMIIENVENDKADRKSLRNSIIMGVYFIVAGILINIFSYTIAVKANSLYFILFWGIVAYGIVTIVRGFILYKK
jgi:hypothetical protein